MTQEALKLALKDLRCMASDLGRFENEIPSIKAIEEALAQPEEEPLHPVHIGVDVTREGTAVTAFYRKPDAVMEMFYSQFHPMAQPEQEPVAWMSSGEARMIHWKSKHPGFGDDWIPLYTKEQL